MASPQPRIGRLEFLNLGLEFKELHLPTLVELACYQAIGDCILKAPVGERPFIPT